ncbi:MAG: TraB/GumN family protein [Sedimentisphaerales bacterium]|nr:TraB/GumN family protein [Sedimentisphaerales bacterium]
MPENDTTLADSVKHIKIDGKDVYLVGTAHVSKESVEDVRNTVKAVSPNSICTELCEARCRAMVEKDNWEKMDIFKVIKQKKSVLLLAQLVMSAFYRKLGDELGVEPGAEMLECVKLSAETGAELILADRDIEITLKRVWRGLGFFQKFKLTLSLLYSLIDNEEIDENTVEKMKNSDQLESMMESFAESYPQIKERLLDERDVYLSQKIRNAPGPVVVAAVGAGHVNGIVEHIQQDIDLEPIMQLPPKTILPTILKWVVPILIVGLLVAGFFKGGIEHSKIDLLIWVLVNGVFSAIGAAVALAHPLTVIASFIAAPLTSLNPMVAAGFVSGLVQAWIKRPTVDDFKRLPHDIMSVKGFWMNPVTRILLVVILANLGSAIGTWVAGFWIGARAM